MRDAPAAATVIMPAQTKILRADSIAQSLAAYRHGPIRGDHLLNDVALPRQPWRRAAVLLVLLADGDEISVVFTLRTAHLHAHAGQVSFPGGGAEAHDADSSATALRESHEEIGLDPARVTVLGTLDSYVTISGYEVTPVVGIIDVTEGGLPVWQPDEFEVAEIFHVPLTHILTPGVLRPEAISREGVIRHTYVCSWNDYNIWGATAGMLRNFVEAISA